MKQLPWFFGILLLGCTGKTDTLGRLNQALSDRNAEHDVKALFTEAGFPDVAISCRTPDPPVRGARCTFPLTQQQYSAIHTHLQLQPKVPERDFHTNMCDEFLVAGAVFEESIGNRIWRPNFHGQGFGVFLLLWSRTGQKACLRLDLGWE